jgi:hypothetical protein
MVVLHHMGELAGAHHPVLSAALPMSRALNGGRCGFQETHGWPWMESFEYGKNCPC